MLPNKLKKFFKIKGKEESQKELEEVLTKVIQKFSEIKEKEIKITYNPSEFEVHGGLVTTAGYASIDKVCNNKTPYVKAEITVNPIFFRLDDQEKEAMIAHELGHYPHVDIEINSKEEDLKYQIIADNKAAEVGYGHTFLKILKKELEKSKEQSSLFSFTLIPKRQSDLPSLQARIVNLEQRMMGYNT